MHINEADIATFRSDGVVALRQMVSADWLEELAVAIEDDINNPGPFYHGYVADNGAGRFHGNLRIWESHDIFRRFCCESEMPEIARELFGSEQVNLLYDQLFVKEPGTLNPTRWHNDQPYWPIRGTQVLSIWVALDPTTLDSGALEFVKGSHLWNRHFQPEVFGRASVEAYERNPDYEPIPDFDSLRDSYEIISHDLDPGDVYVFHGLTVHGAPGNSSKTLRRRGYAVRYTGDDVRYSSHPGTNKGLRNGSLKDGDDLSCDQYPRVLPR